MWKSDRREHLMKVTGIETLHCDAELFTHLPVIEDGYLVVPDRPGWGTEPVEDALRAHPPKNQAGLLSFGRPAL